MKGLAKVNSKHLANKLQQKFVHSPLIQDSPDGLKGMILQNKKEFITTHTKHICRLLQRSYNS
jgi:hypothetical protein